METQNSIRTRFICKEIHDIYMSVKDQLISRQSLDDIKFNSILTETLRNSNDGMLFYGVSNLDDYIRIDDVLNIWFTVVDGKMNHAFSCSKYTYSLIMYNGKSIHYQIDQLYKIVPEIFENKLYAISNPYYKDEIRLHNYIGFSNGKTPDEAISNFIDHQKSLSDKFRIVDFDSDDIHLSLVADEIVSPDQPDNIIQANQSKFDEINKLNVSLSYTLNYSLTEIDSNLSET